MSEDDNDAALANFQELEQWERQIDEARAADRDALDKWLDTFSRFLNQHERAA